MNILAVVISSKVNELRSSLHLGAYVSMLELQAVMGKKAY